MAHDPRREDYQRLSLQFLRQLEESGDDKTATRAFTVFSRDYAQKRDALPQTDADRAFHLVVLASEAIDYDLPFATSEKMAQGFIDRAHKLLDEAVALDPNCFDAVRMRASAEISSIDERFRFLEEREEQVRSYCQGEADRILASDKNLERARLSADLALRPWWRWLAAMAEQALICGRNREALAIGERLLESDTQDESDVRFTMAYALAKLEDSEGLEALAARYAQISPLRPDDDAWMCLARLAICHKRMDFDGARAQIGRLRQKYPQVIGTLMHQTELPDGEFARLFVRPYSEDELIIAVSEGIVLLQEGTDRSGRGVLGSWVAHEAAAADPEEAARVLRESAELRAASNGTGGASGTSSEGGAQ